MPETDQCTHPSHCRAASTTQKALAVTSAAPDTLVTRAEGGLTTASPAPAPTMRPREGEGSPTTRAHPTVYGTGCEKHTARHHTEGLSKKERILQCF